MENEENKLNNEFVGTVALVKDDLDDENPYWKEGVQIEQKQKVNYIFKAKKKDV